LPKARCSASVDGRRGHPGVVAGDHDHELGWDPGQPIPGHHVADRRRRRPHRARCLEDGSRTEAPAGRAERCRPRWSPRLRPRSGRSASVRAPPTHPGWAGPHQTPGSAVRPSGFRLRSCPCWPRTSDGGRGGPLSVRIRGGLRERRQQHQQHSDHDHDHGAEPNTDPGHRCFSGTGIGSAVTPTESGTSTASTWSNSPS
jgi:hypothetical protein